MKMLYLILIFMHYNNNNYKIIMLQKQDHHEGKEKEDNLMKIIWMEPIIEMQKVCLLIIICLHQKIANTVWQWI